MEKTITPNYILRPTRSGVRQKLTGYIGQITDGDTVIHAMEYSTHSEAETALDRLMFDLLSAAPAAAAAPAEPATTCVFCSKPHHPQHCPEKNALLFAPDSVRHFCECGKAAIWYALFSDTPYTMYFCGECGEKTEYLVGVIDPNQVMPPLDLDFAPIGPEV
jgi:hypothetical protein